MSSLAPLAPTFRHGDDAAQLASQQAAAQAADAAAYIEPNVFTDAQIDEYKEQDRYLPIANVGRIMKAALPDNAKIAKEAKECVQECVSEFISFLVSFRALATLPANPAAAPRPYPQSSEAAEKVLNDKRKTINGEDILYSMTSLGFDNYAEACKVYLAKYRSRQLNQEPSISHRTSLALTTSHQASPDRGLSTHTGGSSPSAEDDEHSDADDRGGDTSKLAKKGSKSQGKKRPAALGATPAAPPPFHQDRIAEEDSDEADADAGGSGGGGKRRRVLVPPLQHQVARPGPGQAPPGRNTER
ncbi:hypothetical protein QFC19_006756 [Naganishia cerealis]|uniref:Uncharacterized protein n=1 Tax=Naganishia cerealis TaxID=610337 RepID=A0ACC2VES3_9TREE|nr:hypothetical protein QFC19_006756 [Naganishia cerealis]